MPLPMAVRTNHDADRTGGVYPHRRCIIKTRPGPQHANDVRGRDTAGLNIAIDAQTTQLAIGLAFRPSRGKASQISSGLKLVHRPVVVPGVIGQRHRRVIGELGDESSDGAGRSDRHPVHALPCR